MKTEAIKSQLIAHGVDAELATRAAVVIAKPERTDAEQAIVTAAWKQLQAK